MAGVKNFAIVSPPCENSQIEPTAGGDLKRPPFRAALLRPGMLRNFLARAFMAHRALHRRWGFDRGFVFLRFGVTAGTVSMKRLLISEADHRSAPFVFDLRNRGDQFRGFGRPCVTIPAGRYTRSGRILCEKLSGKCGRSIRRPCCFERRVFRDFAGRLCDVVTFYTRDRSRTVDTVFSAVVADVVESNATELTVFRENNHVRHLDVWFRLSSDPLSRDLVLHYQHCENAAGQNDKRHEYILHLGTSWISFV